MRRSRRHAFTVVLTLALGIGAGTAIFTVMKAALLDPWPYLDGDRIVTFRGDHPELGRSHYPLWSAAEIAEIRELDGLFAHVMAGRGRDYNVTAGEGWPERILGARVTASTFPMLGIQPMLGRALDERDEAAGAEPVAVIGHGLWQRRFGGDPAVLGLTLELDGIKHAIVGVMPPRFRWWNSEIWVPVSAVWTGDARDRRELAIQARLRPGVSLAQLNAALDVWAHRVERDHAAEFPEYRGWRAWSESLVDAVLRDIRETLAVLFAGALLLIAVAGFNAASLMLARTAERQRELAVRVALGASRHRIVSTLLRENLALATLGGAFGVVLSIACVGAIAGLIPADRFPAEANMAPDWRVLVFGFGSALAVGLLAALPAAFALRKLSPGGALHGARTSGDRAEVRTRMLLVAGQVAVAVTVLAAAWQVSSGFLARLNADVGFEREHAVSLRITLPAQRYPDRDAVGAFYEALLERLGSLPGTFATGTSFTAPLGGGPVYPLRIEATPDPVGETRYDVTGGEWFAAIGIPLRAGRLPDARDRDGGLPVAVVNEAFAGTFLPGADPIGQRVRTGPPGNEDQWLTVIGVVGNVRSGDIDQPLLPALYQPLAQAPLRPRNLVVMVRSVRDAEAVATEVRAATLAIDPELPVHDVRTAREIVGDALGGQRLAAVLLAVFGAVVLLLSVLGVYGVVTYLVGRSKREFGVRVAVGARPVDIVALVGRRGTRLAAVGIGAGIILALAALHIGGTFLPDLRANDPVTLTLVAAGMFVAVLLGCAVPALRGAAVDPMHALREEG